MVIDLHKVDDNMLNLINELEQKGYVHSDGTLCYADSDKEEIAAIFAKYGKAFLE